MNDISASILIVNESRRRFLQGAGGLALGDRAEGTVDASSGHSRQGGATGAAAGAADPAEDWTFMPLQRRRRKC